LATNDVGYFDSPHTIRQFETFGRREIQVPASRHVVFDDHNHVFESSTDPDEVDYEDSLNQPPDSLHENYNKVSFGSSNSDKDSDTESFESILVNKVTTMSEMSPTIHSQTCDEDLLVNLKDSPTHKDFEIEHENHSNLSDNEEIQIKSDESENNTKVENDFEEIIPKQAKVRFAKPIELEIISVSEGSSSEDESDDEPVTVLATVQLNVKPSEYEESTCVAQPVSEDVLIDDDEAPNEDNQPTVKSLANIEDSPESSFSSSSSSDESECSGSFDGPSSEGEEIYSESSKPVAIQSPTPVITQRTKKVSSLEDEELLPQKNEMNENILNEINSYKNQQQQQLQKIMTNTKSQLVLQNQRETCRKEESEKRPQSPNR